MAKISNHLTLSNLFFFLIFINMAPYLFKSIFLQYSKMLEPRTKVAQIDITGVLTNSTRTIKYLKKYFEDDSIKAILLKLETPGGATGTAQAIFNEIKALKKEFPKPIVAITENICVSGGYYIAIAADHIICAPGSALGSIGVLIPYQFKLKQFVEGYNIQYKPVSSGAYKMALDPFLDNTPEQTAMLQDLTDNIYEQFTQDVATQRKLSLSKTKEWANGKIFTGQQALKLNMVDELGSISNAIQRIKEKALIEGKIEWIRPVPKSPFAKLFGQADEDEDSALDTLASWFGDKIFSKLEERFAGIVSR
ncbi:MAG: Signal peptide peptidase [candidate division TM6 bacterium GW2011_GWF2_32_72]|nr:MAG: Signal peptide peptidase [candidate division TM6 bacterium GW2011_GWF2_32_72]